MKVIDLTCLLTFVSGAVGLNNPHLVHWVINMVSRMDIVGPALPTDDVETFHVVHSEPPHICIVVLLIFEFQAHLLLSLNAVIYLVIH